MLTALHALLYMTSAALSVRTRGFRRASAFFALVYAITLSAELWAQEHGLFGVHYYYDLTRWPLPTLGTLPFLVPCMWFAMMFVTQDLAFALAPAGKFRAPWQHALVIATLGATFMVMWDLLLDPVSVSHGLWHWEGAPYPYFDVPLENLAAWFIGTFGTHVILYVALPAPTARVLPAAIVYAVTGLAYLPFLPDARLASVSAAMATTALVAVAVAHPSPWRRLALQPPRP